MHLVTALYQDGDPVERLLHRAAAAEPRLASLLEPSRLALLRAHFGERLAALLAHFKACAEAPHHQADIL